MGCLLHPVGPGNDAMQTHKDVQQHLEECEKKVKHLEEENAHLREASDSFRALAERLSGTRQQDGRRREPSERIGAVLGPNKNENSAGGHEEIGDF